jgi:DNA-binding LytR/AlgR family response regulator
MKKIRTLIVDDEPIAQDILETYILKIPELELAGKCRNALEAFSMLNKVQTDLMLLDINMPEISGMDFLKSLKNPPHVIFTTAYSEFAIESYEQNAIDYLLKPISFERFLKAIDKTVKIINSESSENTASITTHGTAAENANNLVFVKSEGKLIKIDLNQLWLVEGLKDYVQLWMDDTKVIVHSTMKSLEELLLSNPHFIRVHKSYIINMQYIDEVWGNSIKIKNQTIIIGNTYKEEVNRVLDGYKLI